MRVVAGLGNPGQRYRRTRHNAGFMAIDVLASRASVRERRRSVYASLFDLLRCARPDGRAAWVAEASLAGRAVSLVKPLAFMNRSGPPIARVLSEAGCSPAELIVIVDDVALALGTIRVRERGSDGGHNGLRSVTAALGTGEYTRVRVGVASGALPADLADYVLSEVPAQDAALFDGAVRLAADAVECALDAGTAAAMNRFNGRRA